VLGVLLGLAAVEAMDGRRLPMASRSSGSPRRRRAVPGRLTFGSRALARPGRSVLGRPGRRRWVKMARRLPRVRPDPPRWLGGVPAGRVCRLPRGAHRAGTRPGVARLPVGSPRGSPAEPPLGQLRGRAGHAGTSPMTSAATPCRPRRSWVLEVERLARSLAGSGGPSAPSRRAPGAGQRSCPSGDASASTSGTRGPGRERRRRAAGLRRRGRRATRAGLRVDQASTTPPSPVATRR